MSHLAHLAVSVVSRQGGIDLGGGLLHPRAAVARQ